MKKNRPVSETSKFLSLAVFVFPRKWQAMPVLIHTGPQSAKSLRDFPLCLLVEGSAPKPLLNTEFHSVAARSANAFDHDRLTAGRGLFPVLFSVPRPFSALGLHLPLPLKAPAFPHGNACTRRRPFSFLPAISRTPSATL